MMIVVSSKNTKDDFTRKLVEDQKNDPTVFVRDYALWDVKSDRYSKETFQVLVGNENVTSKVLEPKEVAEVSENLQEGMHILEVPIDFKPDFENDTEGSIRDIAGVETVSVSPFIQQRDRIALCTNNENFPQRKHPFDVEEWDQSKSGGFRWSRLAHEVEVRDGGESFVAWQPKYYPGHTRHVHIDPSLNSDSTGVAVGCVVGYTEVRRRDRDNFTEIYTESAPVIWIDFMLRVVPPVGGEINYGKIRSLVYQMQAHGFPIGLATMDQYNSADTMQKFTIKGIECERLSLDRTMDPYDTTKAAIYEGRCHMYRYAPAREELQALQKDNVKNKVDHPPKGCFTGDTRVALLDGTLPTFEELALRFPNGERFPVYSVGADGVCVGWGESPRVTRKAAELVEVVLDNYQVIECTPDHLFMTLDREWVQAQNLTQDVSLMPLYRSRTNSGGWAGYERMYCPVRGERIMTHQMVATQFFGELSGRHVHHEDEVKHNNHPDNLTAPTSSDHVRRHTKKRHEEDREYVVALRDGHARYRADGGNERSRENIERLFAEGKLKRGRDLCSIEGCISLQDARGLCGKHYQRARRKKVLPQRASGSRNHRILSVRKISKTADVWDITVPELENFALASGVFVHNSKDVADAIAGVVFSLTTNYRGGPLDIMKGISSYGHMSTEEQRVMVERPQTGDEDEIMLPFIQG